MSLVSLDKRKTDRSQVSSASAAYNDKKMSKSPSVTFPGPDGSITSGSKFPSGSMGAASGSLSTAAKSPKGRLILPITINKLPSQQLQQQQQPSIMDKNQPTSPDKSEATPVTPAGGGEQPVMLRPDLGMKFEFVLGLLASAVLLGLWIYLMSTECWEKQDMVFWVKTFAVLGTIAGLFVSIYCCFERTISPARGFAACLYISFLSMVGGLNLVGAYVATTCICTCRDNAIRNAKSEDLIIFILELVGAICLLGVILVASLTRPMT